MVRSELNKLKWATFGAVDKLLLKSPNVSDFLVKMTQ